MNIVSNTAPSNAKSATRPELVGTGHIVPVAGDGTDTAAPVRGFGVLLTKHLDDAASGDAAGRTVSRGEPGAWPQADAGVAKAVEAADPPVVLAATDPAATTATTPTTATAPRPDEANVATSPTSPALFPALVPSSTATSAPQATATDGTTRKGRSDDERVADSAAGSDLAAQLALASQWAAVAKPVDPATPQAPTAATSGVTTGVADVKAAIGKDRASPAKQDPSVVRTIATANEATGKPVAGASTDASTDDRRQGGAPAGNASIVATKDDVKSRDALAVAALDAAAAAPVHPQATPDGDAFGLRLASHVANVQTSISTPTATAAVAPSTTAFVREPVGTPAWSHEVGQATLRMAANDLQSASIRLNPEHLGPLDVQVRVDNGVAHLAFNATHVDTRQALEASRATLDQLFSSQGLKMGDVSVGSGSSNGSTDASAARGDPGGNASRGDGGRWSGNDATDGDPSVKTVTTRIARALGLVDTFA